MWFLGTFVQSSIRTSRTRWQPRMSRLPRQRDGRSCVIMVTIGLIMQENECNDKVFCTWPQPQALLGRYSYVAPLALPWLRCPDAIGLPYPELFHPVGVPLMPSAHISAETMCFYRGTMRKVVKKFGNREIIRIFAVETTTQADECLSPSVEDDHSSRWVPFSGCRKRPLKWMSAFLRVSETTTQANEYLSPNVGDDHSDRWVLKPKINLF